MVTFTKGEMQVLDESIQILRLLDSPFASIVESQSKDLEQLAGIVDRAPSPNIDLFHLADARNFETLARKLSSQGLNHVVNLPTKAVLGHGFTVSKLHLFGLLIKLLETIKELEPCRKGIEQEYHDLLFTLMAEDLYTALISEQDIDAPWVQPAVHELIMMWDHRTSGYLETFALAIRELWQARHSIVPVLGTLLGTMEIMRLNTLLPPVWVDFLSNISNQNGIAHALEEFIFDLRYEELITLRSRMVMEGIQVVDRTTAWQMLGKSETQAPQLDPALALYKSYMNRQQAAKIRMYRNDMGPNRSLEEFFVIYLLSSTDYPK